MDHSAFFINLPSEIVIEIMSILPIKTIIHCKSVCKSWLHLLETTEFVKYHNSKSIPGLVLYTHKDFKFHPSIKLLEFIDELGLEHHKLHYNLVTEFDITTFISPLHVIIFLRGSVNGLVFLHKLNPLPEALYICNPITREFIDVPKLERIVGYKSTYGFGLSKTRGQYKVVRISHERVLRDQETGSLSTPKSECKIYTLGTGCSWRTISTPSFTYKYDTCSSGVFLNGNLHWLVVDLMQSLLISCFDLEKEEFNTFSAPSPTTNISVFMDCCVNVLGDCLCFCDNSSENENEIVIWIMKEYGVEKSWKKEFVISKYSDGDSVVIPVKVFRDGDILMSWEDIQLFYSNKTKSTLRLDIFGLGDFGVTQTMIHAPSFVSLRRCFPMENICSF